MLARFFSFATFYTFDIFVIFSLPCPPPPFLFTFFWRGDSFIARGLSAISVFRLPFFSFSVKSDLCSFLFFIFLCLCPIVSFPSQSTPQFQSNGFAVLCLLNTLFGFLIYFFKESWKRRNVWLFNFCSNHERPCILRTFTVKIFISVHWVFFFSFVTHNFIWFFYVFLHFFFPLEFFIFPKGIHFQILIIFFSRYFFLFKNFLFSFGFFIN